MQTQEVPQDHNASSLKEVLSSLFDSWKISDKVCGATTDNGRNIVNAIGLLKIEHFPCVAHTLQLSIKKTLYPLMCRLVLRIFSFVATSVPSERLFSSAGNIITEKRNCLTPQHADQLIFLYENTK